MVQVNETPNRRVRTGPGVVIPRAHGGNPGTALDLDWVREIRVNRSAVERRAATLPRRRTVKKDWQIAWLLRAVTCLDLTTLSGDDTPGRVRRLCAKARQPVRLDVLEGLGAAQLDVRVAAVCVYHAMVETAVEALRGSGIPVAAVPSLIRTTRSVPLAASNRRIAGASTCTPSAITSAVTSGEVSTAPITPVSWCENGRIALNT